MGSNTYKLAKKKASKMQITADEPDVQRAQDETDIAAYERKKMDPGSSEDNIEAAGRVPGKYPQAKVPSDPDTKMMKQRKKMMMLKTLLGQMDDMDGDGIPDSKDR